MRGASCGAVPGTSNLENLVPRAANSGSMPRYGSSASGSGLPGRFRNSESVIPLSLNVFIGSELPLRRHVARQAAVKLVTVYEARGRLIAALDILERAWL